MPRRGEAIKRWLKRRRVEEDDKEIGNDDEEDIMDVCGRVDDVANSNVEQNEMVGDLGGFLSMDTVVTDELDNLCDSDLEKLYALFSSDISFEGIARIIQAFDPFNMELLRIARRILYQEDVKKVFFCVVCGFEGSSKECNRCGNKAATIILKDGARQVDKILNRNRQAVREVHENARKNISCESIAATGLVKQYITDGNDDSLHIAISWDGISYKGMGSSTKVWPIFAQCLDLPHSERIVKKNSILVGMYCYKADPTTAVFNYIVKRFVQDIEGRGRLISVIADRPAMKTAFSFAHHSSSYSCRYCLTPKKIHKPLPGLNRRKVRGPHGTREDVRLGQLGFRAEIPEIAKHVLIYDTPIDYLHSFCEGIQKKISQGIFPSMFPDVRSTPFRVYTKTNLLKCLEEMKLPTGFRRYDGGRMTFCCGQIYENISIFFAPAIAVIAVFPLLETTLITIAFSWVSLYLHHREWSAAGRMLTLQSVMVETAKLAVSAFKNKIPVNLHEILYHLPEVLQHVGNPVDFSTAWTETLNSQLKSSLSEKSTADRARNIATRFSILNDIQEHIQRRAGSSDDVDFHEDIAGNVHIGNHRFVAYSLGRTTDDSIILVKDCAYRVMSVFKKNGKTMLSVLVVDTTKLVIRMDESWPFRKSGINLLTSLNSIPLIRVAELTHNLAVLDSKCVTGKGALVQVPGYCIQMLYDVSYYAHSK